SCRRISSTSSAWRALASAAVIRDELHEFSGRETSLVWMSEWRREQAPNPKLQAPKKHQAPSSKTDLRAVASASVFGLGCIEIWNFSGAWGLVLGVSLGQWLKN